MYFCVCTNRLMFACVCMYCLHDNCMDQFTPGQTKVMQAAWETYRHKLGESEFVTLDSDGFSCTTGPPEIVTSSSTTSTVAATTTDVATYTTTTTADESPATTDSATTTPEATTSIAITTPVVTTTTTTAKAGKR